MEGFITNVAWVFLVIFGLLSLCGLFIFIWQRVSTAGKLDRIGDHIRGKSYNFPFWWLFICFVCCAWIWR